MSDYQESKRAQIVDALARQDITDPPLLEIVSVPPFSRRRATLKLQQTADGMRVGFHAPRSHALIDIQECHVLTPALFAAARGISQGLSPLLRENEAAELYLADTDTGIDISLHWKRPPTQELVAAISAVASKLQIARVMSDSQLVFERSGPRMRFGKADVKLPPDAFLQPTREGEAVLQSRVAEAVGKAKKIADLFCGCGTFALPLAERAHVHAVDSDPPMLLALADGGRSASGLKPVTTERRDLFKHPLSAAELNRFDAAVLDPPRAGALAQAKELAKSALRRIAYVSCDAASFARDARVLRDGGFRLDWIMGVDQFLWSAHIELAAAFSKK